MLARNKRLIGIMVTAGVLLLIPFVAMQFTSEVNWTVPDFVVAASLLFGAGFLIEFVIRKVQQSNHRVAIALGVLVFLILFWMELAVGIFGTPLAGS
jgi:hypothetical protein